MLKKIWCVALLLVLTASVQQSAGQDSPQARFEQANDALENSDYSQALTIYRELEQEHIVSGALFLNMGITYLRLDSLGYAKYYFLKAGHFEETEAMASEALEFVNNRFSRQSAVLPKLPWDVAVEWLQHNIGADTLLAISLILLNTGIVIFVARWFVTKYENVLYYAGSAVTGIAVLLMLASFYTDYVAERYSTAVMITQKAPVMEQPAEDASLVSHAYEGYTFTVDHHRSSRQDDWHYVRMSNGLYGWIPESEIRVL